MSDSRYDPWGLARRTESGGSNWLGDFLNEVDLTSESSWLKKGAAIAADAVGNTFSDMLGLDTIADSTMVAGDSSRSTGERLAAAGEGALTAVMDVAGGEVVGTAGKVLARIPGVSRAIGAIAKTRFGRVLSADVGEALSRTVGFDDVGEAVGRGLSEGAEEGIRAGTPDFTTPRMRLQQNRRSGNAVRDAIAEREGTGLKEQPYKVTGGYRFVDVVVEGGDTVAIESKVGRTGLGRSGSRVRQELARDVKLLRTGQVDRVAWEFSRSPRTGKIGPSPGLEAKLRKLGIEIRVNQ